jgi:hypothetical protein
MKTRCVGHRTFQAFNLRLHLLSLETKRLKLSFRGDAKRRTRNLEIPVLVLRTIPE